MAFLYKPPHLQDPAQGIYTQAKWPEPVPLSPDLFSFFSSSNIFLLLFSPVNLVIGISKSVNKTMGWVHSLGVSCHRRSLKP